MAISGPYPPPSFSNQSPGTIPPYDEDEDHIGTSSHNIPIGYAASTSAQATNWVPHLPSPSSPTDSEQELYGPDRLYGSLLADTSRPVVVEGPGFRLPELPPYPMSQQPAWETAFNASMLTGFRDELAREAAGRETPGVDIMPSIRYALDAITRDRDTGYAGNPSPVTEDGELTPRYIPPSQGLLPSPTIARQPVPRQAQRPPRSGPRESGLSPMERYLERPQREAQVPLLAYQPPHPPPSHPPPSHPPPSHPPPSHPSPAPVSAGSTSKKPRLPYLKFPAFQMPGDSIPSRDSRESGNSGPQPRRDNKRRVEPHQWRPLTDDEVEDFKLQPLTYKPRLLRPLSFLTLTILCFLMITALIFCAVYSQLYDGLTPYASIYGGLYFTFRILPQMLAAVVLIYAQCLITTMLRIIPFARLASEDPNERNGAISEDLYPKSFIWPHLVGSSRTWVLVLVVWLTNFTVPLQSSVFTVIYKDGVWYWATVQGVAWTLVALYMALLFATVMAWSFWARVTNTGLLWDPRSLADIIVMISNTNTARDFSGTKTATSRASVMFGLRRRADDRLTYWGWKDKRDDSHWYAMGNTLDDANFVPVSGTEAKGVSLEREKRGMMHQDGTLGPDVEDGQAKEVQFSYLPWCLHTGPLSFSIVATFTLLVALFVVSFLPSTHISGGFPPDLSSAPVAGAFSAADFLYSFLPASLGMILYLLFQSLDQSIRILEPWAALANLRGAPPEKSVLADYAACSLPLHAGLHALQNRDWRVAAVSTLSTLFVLIPIVAGGMFMALTEPSGQVRMFANIPAYAVILTLLVLYFLGLLAALPGRKEMHLPHDVTCLAEIVGFLINDELLADETFRDCLNREIMLSRLGMHDDTPDSRARWIFGFPMHKNVERVVGVRALRSFTEKNRVRKSQISRARGARVVTSLEV